MKELSEWSYKFISIHRLIYLVEIPNKKSQIIYPVK